MLTEEQVYLNIEEEEINGKYYKFYFKSDADESFEISDIDLYGINGLSVGGKGEFDLHMLKNFSDIRGLALNTHDYYKSTITLQRFRRLEYFRVLELCDSIIPFDQFKNLHTADVNYDHKTCRMLFDNPSIEYLDLYNYKQKSTEDLAKLKTLKQFAIKQCVIENLNFLENLPQLKSFTIGRNRKLISIAGLSRAKNLKKLEISYCKKIEDWNSLAQSSQLNVIILEDCGEIESLAFLESFPNLKIIRIFGNTIIKDGLLKALVSKESLEFASIVIHKHYDISEDDLKWFNFICMSEVLKKIEI